MSLYPDTEPREQFDPLGRDRDDEEPGNEIPAGEPRAATGDYVEATGDDPAGAALQSSAVFVMGSAAPLPCGPERGDSGHTITSFEWAVQRAILDHRLSAQQAVDALREITASIEAVIRAKNDLDGAICPF